MKKNQKKIVCIFVDVTVCLIVSIQYLYTLLPLPQKKKIWNMIHTQKTNTYTIYILYMCCVECYIIVLHDMFNVKSSNFPLPLIVPPGFVSLPPPIPLSLSLSVCQRITLKPHIKPWVFRHIRYWECAYPIDTISIFAPATFTQPHHKYRM